MLLAVQPVLLTRDRILLRPRAEAPVLALSAALALLGCPAAALAQDSAKPPAPAEASAEKSQIDFEADGLAYDNDADTVTASGNVVLRRDGQSVRADSVTGTARPARFLPTATSGLSMPMATSCSATR